MWISLWINILPIFNDLIFEIRQHCFLPCPFKLLSEINQVLIFTLIFFIDESLVFDNLRYVLSTNRIEKLFFQLVLVILLRIILHVSLVSAQLLTIIFILLFLFDALEFVRRWNDYNRLLFALSGFFLWAWLGFIRWFGFSIFVD